MSDTICLGCPAKLNFHLEVGARDCSGYHPIHSLFQAIELEDRIEVRLTRERRKCRIEGVEGVPEKDNTIYKAFDFFYKNTRSDASFDVRVKKAIPSGSGMGGGSSDAASALMAFYSLTGFDISKVSASDIGINIGYDVPFFLKRRASFVHGRGELVEPLAIGRLFDIVIVMPSFRISTRDAYSTLDALRSSGLGECHFRLNRKAIEEIYSRDPSEWQFWNDFSLSYGTRFPELPRDIDLLKKNGASFSGMTGSGSAVFGIFMDRDSALKASGYFEKQGIQSFLTRTLAPA